MRIAFQDMRSGNKNYYYNWSNTLEVEKRAEAIQMNEGYM